MLLWAWNLISEKGATSDNMLFAPKSSMPQKPQNKDLSS